MPASGDLPFESVVATGRGDDGTTGLLYGGPRILKDDPRTEAYGTIDEAVAAMGIARAELTTKERYGVRSASFGQLDETILRLQRELFVVAAELATTPDAWDRLEPGRTKTTAEMVDRVGRLMADLESHVTMPREFVVPGETRIGAALELARSVLRRAERRTVSLVHAGALPPDSQALPYLNRLADLLWVLARAAEQAESRQAPSATRRADVPPDGDAAGPDDRSMNQEHIPQGGRSR